MSTENLQPRDAAEVGEAMRWALSGGKALELIGRGSKRAIGRAAQWDATLDLSGLSGVTLYEPEELVLSAKAGTPLAEIEALVAASGQELAFEPMDYGPLLGVAAGVGSIGGVLAANLSAGAASKRAPRATISSASTPFPAAAKPSSPAAASSRTSPATICASSRRLLGHARGDDRHHDQDTAARGDRGNDPRYRPR